MATNVTADRLVNAILHLPKDRDYPYISDSTPSLISIVEVSPPYGPITIKRWNPTKGQSKASAEPATISEQMLWRYANAIKEGIPFNADRIFGASYNTRSVLESLVAATPEFYYCYPGRIENINGVTSVREGHKHLIWLPSKPHANGVFVEEDFKQAISEISLSVAHESISFPTAYTMEGISPEVARRHTQMQISIAEIGDKIGYKTFIAKNDQYILYNGMPISSYPYIIKDLASVATISACTGAVKAGELIDAIWIDGNRIIACFEVEHSTGVTSGLTRMNGFRIATEGLQNDTFVIVADDALHNEAINKMAVPQFKEVLNAKYMSYSAVEELKYISMHRNIHKIPNAFIQSFLEELPQ